MPGELLTSLLAVSVINATNADWTRRRSSLGRIDLAEAKLLETDSISTKMPLPGIIQARTVVFRCDALKINRLPS
jgi:hypothetical protein